MCAVYSPRDPIAEFWRGDITLRQLRVLIDGLDDSTAYGRAVNGPWRDNEALLWNIESRLREVKAQLAAILTRRDQAIELLPTPPPTEAAMEAEREATKKRAQDRAARIKDASDFEASLIPRQGG